MALGLDRTNFDAAIDDSGSGTDGTILDKAAYEEQLLDPIDDVLETISTSIDDAGRVSLAPSTELTIASGVVTVVGNRHSVDTEANAASDDLDTLTGGANVEDGHLLVLKAENAARVVTVKTGTGNVLLKGGDCALDHANARLFLVKEGANWCELGRSAVAVADDSVTNTKLANMATLKIKARKTGSTGDPEDCSLSEVLDFVTSAARGDILYRGASTWTRLGVGTAGYVVRSDGPDLAWGPATRANGTTSSATPTPNCDTTDVYELTALATAPTFAAPTGTPYNGQKLLIRIKDNATPRALSWNGAYVAGGTALPTTTVASKILKIGFIYNTANSLNKWECVGAQQEA